MPTYEYQCLKCRKKFEKLQRITETPAARCPFCRGKVRRLISGGVGLIFKGSGFYSTDYKKQPKDPAKPADKPKETPKQDKKESSAKTASSGKGE